MKAKFFSMKEFGVSLKNKLNNKIKEMAEQREKASQEKEELSAEENKANEKRKGWREANFC